MASARTSLATSRGNRQKALPWSSPRDWPEQEQKTQEQTDDNLPMVLIGVGSGKQLQPHNNLVGITGNQY
jgi:hypothetical protein